MKPKHTAILLAAALLSACGETKTTTAAPAATATSPELAAVIDAEPKGKAIAIHTARESAKPGDEITIRGRVMGSARPFVADRAAFILGDPEVLTACSDRPGDECETPWDTCCDTAEDKKRGTATVQILDDDGRVLREGIEGVGGIAKLATLTVAGTVAETSTPDVLVINALAIDVAE